MQDVPVELGDAVECRERACRAVVTSPNPFAMHRASEALVMSDFRRCGFAFLVEPGLEDRPFRGHLFFNCDP